MKKITLFSICLCSAILFSCSDNELGLDINNVESTETTRTVEFPAEDGAKKLSGFGADMLKNLINSCDPATLGGDLGRIEITDEQYNEIKTFTDSLVNGKSGDTEIYETIFNWVNKNIKYSYEGADNNPYPVFTNKLAICTGYSNLLNVMLNTQSIPCVNVHGQLIGVGGHTWNYVYHGSKWVLSDPTNNLQYDMNSTASYSNKFYPQYMDAYIAEDDNFVYNWYENNINICRVKSTAEQLVIPYSVNGYIITMFNPYDYTPSNLPASIKEIYIGKNIESLGENIKALAHYGPNIEAVYVDPENETLRSYSNAIYWAWGTTPIYIAAKAKVIELLPAEEYDKETIKDHYYVETLIFPKGTKTIYAWAVENCPNLTSVYYPVGTTVEENAFTKVPEDIQFIEGEYTNIVPVKM